MNRRRFLSCALVPLVPIVPAAAEPVFIGMDWTTTAQPVFVEADAFMAWLGMFIDELNAVVRARS